MPRSTTSSVSSRRPSSPSVPLARWCSSSSLCVIGSSAGSPVRRRFGLGAARSMRGVVVPCPPGRSVTACRPWSGPWKSAGSGLLQGPPGRRRPHGWDGRHGRTHSRAAARQGVSVAVAGSSDRGEGSLDGSRKRDRHEELLWKEVVLARFVGNPGHMPVFV